MTITGFEQPVIVASWITAAARCSARAPGSVVDKSGAQTAQVALVRGCSAQAQIQNRHKSSSLAIAGCKTTGVAANLPAYPAAGAAFAAAGASLVAVRLSFRHSKDIELQRFRREVLMPSLANLVAASDRHVKTCGALLYVSAVHSSSNDRQRLRDDERDAINQFESAEAKLRLVGEVI